MSEAAVATPGNSAAANRSDRGPRAGTGRADRGNHPQSAARRSQHSALREKPATQPRPGPEIPDALRDHGELSAGTAPVPIHHVVSVRQRTVRPGCPRPEHRTSRPDGTLIAPPSARSSTTPPGSGGSPATPPHPLPSMRSAGADDRQTAGSPPPGRTPRSPSGDQIRRRVDRSERRRRPASPPAVPGLQPPSPHHPTSSSNSPRFWPLFPPSCCMGE